jgi:hypothetical protein
MVAACPLLGGPGVRRCGCSTPDHQAAIVKNRLKRIQYRPGLRLEPEPP